MGNTALLAIERAGRHAPFLRQLILRHPDIVACVEAGDAAGALARAGLVDPDAAATGATAVGAALRWERQRLALAVALSDLAGLLPLEGVVRALSDFADRALDAAITAAISERYPGEPVRGFAALALGKHGSRELNYSSDIDPILLFDPETLPHRAREEPVEAAVRIARRVVELLQNREANGYVFRVDLRLRPSPEATPLALPIEAAISYYESSALPWERAAFIRARAAAGDIALGESFLSAIRPFVWRRGIDYGAVREIREISRRIRGHHAQGQRLGPGYDLKRGRGGIREVEFFAQIHQMIHGGREPALRIPATMDALAALAAAGRIGADEAAALEQAYRLYRTIEHRLQMVDDQQTHRLPRQIEALDNVAHLEGLADGEALVALLAPHVERVGAIYDLLGGGQSDGLPRDAEILEQRLAAAGFLDPAAACARIDAWRSGGLRALRTPAALDALEAVLPSLIEQLGRARDPNSALMRLDELVARLPTAINLFRLLEAQPMLGRLIGDVLVHAPTLAEALARRAELIDGLIDASAFECPPDLATLAAEFRKSEAGDDYQMLLDRVRARVSERRFALGVQLIEGASDPIAVAAGYARVAEAALATLAQAAVTEFEAAHGRVPGGELLILALGRLGGGALTHASDLDLVFLFTGHFMTESDGRRPLGATQYFNRLAQRVTAALSVATAAGPLYEVDTRLRPSGVQGLLAVSVESFTEYQRSSAWTWEHMALTRGRVVFGSAPARAEVEAIIDETLRRPRDPAILAADAVKMRSDIAKHKPPSGPLDVKLIPGGLVDCEFCVHFVQLRHGIGLDPRLDVAIAACVEAGLLEPGFATAHRLLTRMLVTLRLVAPNNGEPAEVSRPLVARACDAADWDELLGAYEQARAIVAAEWRRIVELV
ncbi:MAG: glutamate-ammonia-ligase adenylyltransferase [Sphingomonas bacterium]|nr:glutamate-ammonia-ligase adenylyltransferase [Sphingomonas bacterium]